MNKISKTIKPKRMRRTRIKKLGDLLSEIANNTTPVYVGRPTVFGNPWRPMTSHPGSIKWAIDTFTKWLDGADLGHFEIQAARLYKGRERVFATRHDLDAARKRLLAALPALRGKNLSCWCALDQPCHADVLLERANQTQPTTKPTKGAKR